MPPKRKFNNEGEVVVDNKSPTATNSNQLMGVASKRQKMQSSAATSLALTPAASSAAAQHYDRGGKYFDEKLYDEAINEYKLAISHDPNNLNVTYELARAYFAKEEFKQAKRCCKKIIKLLPVCPFTWFLIATIYERMNKKLKAAQFYKRVLTDEKYRSDVSKDAIELRGNCILNLVVILEDRDETERLLREAYENPDFQSKCANYNEIVYQYAIAIHKNKPNTEARQKLCEQLYTTSSKLFMDNAHILTNFGAFLEDTVGDIPRAEEMYRKSIQLQPDDPDSYYNYACIVEKYKHNYELALQQFDKQLQLSPDDEETKMRVKRLKQAHGLQNQCAAKQQQQSPDDKWTHILQQRQWSAACATCKSRFGTYQLYCNTCGTRRNQLPQQQQSPAAASTINNTKLP